MNFGSVVVGTAATEVPLPGAAGSLVLVASGADVTIGGSGVTATPAGPVSASATIPAGATVALASCGSLPQKLYAIGSAAGVLSWFVGEVSALWHSDTA